MADGQNAGKRRSHGRIGTVIKDKWRVDARIGSGGMATVYSATHRNGNRVALKMLHSDMSRDPSLRSRFLREGYVANAVAHPGAVRILDDDVADDGSVFLVMELLEGESLEARRKRMGGRLPTEEVFTVGDQLLDLLESAHQKGIVHRDIKPENIFITHEGQVKVLDFGVARLRDSTQQERTSTGLMLGTPDFMSPEQASGKEVDARSDVWAAGATLFTLLSGEVVHKTAKLRDHLIMTSTVPARSLGVVATDVPPQVVTVIDRALMLKKEDRFQSAREMQDAWRWAYRSVTSGVAPQSFTMLAAPPSAQQARVLVGDDAGPDENTLLASSARPSSRRPITASIRTAPEAEPAEPVEEEHIITPRRQEKDEGEKAAASRRPFPRPSEQPSAKPARSSSRRPRPPSTSVKPPLPRASTRPAPQTRRSSPHHGDGAPALTHVPKAPPLPSFAKSKPPQALDPFVAQFAGTSANDESENTWWKRIGVTMAFALVTLVLGLSAALIWNAWFRHPTFAAHASPASSTSASSATLRPPERRPSSAPASTPRGGGP